MRVTDRIGRRIKLQDVHTLMAVVQAGSMGKAARQLNTSQPNISKSIADLERALGVRLLDRYRQGVEPTDYGRALISGGAAVFDELRQTVKKIEFLADPVAGEVRIGANPALAGGFASVVINRLSKRFSRISFHLVSGISGALFDQLRERNVDFLIARRFGPIDEDRVDFELLFEDVCVVAAGAHSPWARQRSLVLTELVNEPWVLPPPGSGIIWTAMEAFRAVGLEHPRNTVVTDSLQARMNLVATGRFLTIFTDSTLRVPTKRSELRALPVELPPARFPVGIVTLRNRTLNPTARLAIDTVRDVARSLARRK